MKRSYWLILVFLAWCVGGSLWYMFSIKGITTDPAYFKPQPTLLAIVEILVMILVAFMLGFGVAWQLREDTHRTLLMQLEEAEYSLESQRGSLQASHIDFESISRKLQQAEERIGQLMNEKEVRRRQEEDASKQVELWQRQAKAMEIKSQQLEGEITSVKFRIRLLENEVAEKDKSLDKLKEEIAAAPKAAVNHREWSDHPFVRPVEIDANEKDDLTLIKGIGPKFAQKLNALDIFSFRQLKELSGTEVERLAEVIEVFPDRIHRDNWIGQATKLYQKKIEGRS
ncbi:MAG: hypothetical protein ACOYW3_15255 [Bacteroidota bacterium]